MWPGNCHMFWCILYKKMAQRVNSFGENVSLSGDDCTYWTFSLMNLIFESSFPSFLKLAYSCLILSQAWSERHLSVSSMSFLFSPHGPPQASAFTRYGYASQTSTSLIEPTFFTLHTEWTVETKRIIKAYCFSQIQWNSQKLTTTLNCSVHLKSRNPVSE